MRWGGEYVIALKGNQGNLHAEADNFFEQAIEVEPSEANCDYAATEERSRGRFCWGVPLSRTPYPNVKSSVTRPVEYIPNYPKLGVFGIYFQLDYHVSV